MPTYEPVFETSSRLPAGVGTTSCEIRFNLRALASTEVLVFPAGCWYPFEVLAGIQSHEAPAALERLQALQATAEYDMAPEVFRQLAIRLRDILVEYVVRHRLLGERPWPNWLDNPDASRADLVAAFRARLFRNPELFEMFCNLGLQLVRLGHKKIGAKMIWETMRWNQMAAHYPRADESDAPYVLNNNQTAYFARLAAYAHPELAAAFEIRRPPRRKA